jgi:hypothetical protein
LAIKTPNKRKSKLKSCFDNGLRIYSSGCTITLMLYHHAPVCILLIAVAMTQLTPVSPNAWELGTAGLQPSPFPLDAVQINSPHQVDMNFDGTVESLFLDDGRLSIKSGNSIVWKSDATWKVAKASFSDLNMDNIPEATLLVWRPFKPWPVDDFLPHGGAIDTFHDNTGSSCQIILVGWARNEYGEIWAGSALADPVTAFTTGDLNGDGDEELITMEGQYALKGSTPAHGLKVWEWNGFGFTVVSSIKGMFSDLVLVREEQSRILILTP